MDQAKSSSEDQLLQRLAEEEKKYAAREKCWLNQVTQLKGRNKELQQKLLKTINEQKALAEKDSLDKNNVIEYQKRHLGDLVDVTQSISRESERRAAELTTVKWEKNMLENLVEEINFYISKLKTNKEPNQAETLYSILGDLIDGFKSQKQPDQTYAERSKATQTETGQFYNRSNDPVLEVSCYLYRSDITNTWFQTAITRDQTNVILGQHKRGMIDMCNISNHLNIKGIADRKCQSVLLNKQERIYYHGTDAFSAHSILNEGINLTKGARYQDFSNNYGFYVTEDFDSALKKARFKASIKNNLPSKHGAVIAFKIDMSNHTKEYHLSLEVGTQIGRVVWNCVVSHFHSGEKNPVISHWLKDAKYIEGPVSKKVHLSQMECPTPTRFSQVCICSREYAKRFGSLENICFVIFVSE